jgi:DNA-binding transcriptional ArsR family regulator
MNRSGDDLDDPQLIRILRALADAKRLRMIREVAATGEMTCTAIGERLRMAQPTVSHHLKILGEAGVVQIRRDARCAYITVDHDALAALGRTLARSVREPVYRRAVKAALKRPRPRASTH